MRLFPSFLLYIWQLPQNSVGLLFLLFAKGEKKHQLENIRFYYLSDFPGGITLGEYILLSSREEWHIRHEFGHVLQSRILGPLYLLVIGLPSLIHAWLSEIIKCCEKHSEGYYHFWTERWANKISGI